MRPSIGRPKKAGPSIFRPIVVRPVASTSRAQLGSADLFSSSVSSKVVTTTAEAGSSNSVVLREKAADSRPVAAPRIQCPVYKLPSSPVVTTPKPPLPRTQAEKAARWHAKGTPDEFEFLKSSYEIGPLLGKGAFGSVRQCRLLRKNTIVALKLLNKETKAEAISAEARALKMLGSMKFLAHIWAIRKYKDRTYIVMECIDGPSMKRLLRRITYQDLTVLTHHISSALAFVHEKGIVHNDVKPSNILFDRHKRRFVLIDFGLASFAHEERRHPFREEYKCEKCNSTKPKSTCSLCIKKALSGKRAWGTPGYLAPEVELAVPWRNGAVDVWALGLIVLGILLRTLPVLRPKREDREDRIDLIARLIGRQKLESLASQNNRIARVKHWYPGIDFCKLVAYYEILTTELDPVKSWPSFFENSCIGCATILPNNPYGLCVCRKQVLSYTGVQDKLLRELFVVLEHCFQIDPEKRNCAAAIADHCYATLILNYKSANNGIIRIPEIMHAPPLHNFDKLFQIPKNMKPIASNYEGYAEGNS